MTRDFKHSFKTAQRPELSLAVYNAGFQKCPPLYLSLIHISEPTRP